MSGCKNEKMKWNKCKWQNDGSRIVNLIFVSKKFKANSIEVLFRGLRPYFEKKGIKTKVNHLPSERYHNIKVILQNILYVKRLKGDVFHITGNAHFFALFLPGKKTVLTILDLVMLKHHPKGLKHILYKFFWVKLPVWHVASVTCISEKTRQEIIRLYPQFGQKIQVIPCSYADYFQFCRYTFHETCPSILVIGTGWNKNTERIIEAASGLRCRLVIIGKLSDVQLNLLHFYQVEYQNEAGISDEEMLQRYCACDMVCFPSLYEGFGVPIIEAQAVGRPVITSSLSPMKEVAGGAAVLVNPESVKDIRHAVIRVIKDKAFRSELIAKGRENVKKYQPENISKEYVKIYRKVMRRETDK